MKKIILPCLFFLLCTSIRAQEKWSLRKCIEYAIEHNIEMMKQDLQVKNSELELNNSKNSRLPNLNSGVSQGFSFGLYQSPQTGVFNPTNTVVSNTSFSVNTGMPLFQGFQISNEIKMNEFNLLASQEDLNQARENIEIKVAALYMDVLYQKEILKAYKEQITLSLEQVERTRILVESGKAPNSQLYDVQAQLAKDQLNYTQVVNNRDLALLNLAQSLNLLDISNFDVMEPQIEDVFSENLSSLIAPDELFSKTLELRPQIKGANYLINSAESRLKVTRAAYYPSLQLGLSYNTGFAHYFTGENYSFSDQFKQNSRTYLGLNLSIPVFNRFTVRNNVRSAQIQITNAQLQLENTKLNYFKEIQQAYQSAIASQAKYSSSEMVYEAAQVSYDYALERYNLGKSTVFELNDARTKLFNSQSELLQSKYEFIFRLKVLDFYSGKEIDLDK